MRSLGGSRHAPSGRCIVKRAVLGATVFLLGIFLAPYSAGWTFTDDFGDYHLHSYWWEAGTTGDAVLEEANGNLKFTQGSGGNATVRCRRLVEGEFNVEVDFNLEVWPQGSVGSVTLEARTVTESLLAAISRSAASGPVTGGQYQSAAQQSPHAESSATTDLQGRLRITRTGGSITTFYWQDSAWVSLAGSPVSADPAVITLGFDGPLATPAIGTALDNFLLDAPDMPEIAPCIDNPGAVELGPWLDVWAREDFVDNRNPAVAYNVLHDEHLVVWENHRGDMVDIYARRISGSGEVLSWFSIVSDSGRTNDQPVVSYSPVLDEYLVAYVYHLGSSDYDLWARRVAWDGSWMSAEFPIDRAADLQWNPSIAYNSQDDEYMLVYENWWSDGTRDINGKRLSSEGTVLTTQNIIGGSDFTRGFPDVAYNEALNQYLVAYTRDIGTDGDIFGRILTAWAAALTVETPICSDSFDQDFVALAAGPAEYLAVWEDGTWGTDDYNIYACRIAGDGTPVGPSGGFPIAIETERLHADPDVAFAQDGRGYLVAWRFFNPLASGQDIFGRWVLPGEEAAFGGEFPIDDGTMEQAAPAVACSPWGQYFVAEEDGWPGPDSEIRGRFIQPIPLFFVGTGKAAPNEAPLFWWEDWGCGWMYTVEAKDAWGDAWGDAPGVWPTRTTEWLDLSAVESGVPQRVYRVRTRWSPPPW